MNKCLSKFYVSVKRKDGGLYKKTRLLSFRAALNQHLKSPPQQQQIIPQSSHTCEPRVLYQTVQFISISHFKCEEQSQ